MSKFNYYKELEKLGIAYLGRWAQSAKMSASYRNGTLTYCLYLAPANMSGHEVCPKSEHCRAFCLNNSGRNKGDIWVNGGIYNSKINRSRIRKTDLFFKDRQLFMLMLIYEINRAKNYAEKHGMGFSVRLNGTSDISPLAFSYNGVNILDVFPDVVFYDYSKVYTRYGVCERYPNYDLTFSYDGWNWGECENALKMNSRVAVVFFGNKLPKRFCGYDVVDANEYDMRYLDPKCCICGLHYHKTANDYQIINGKRTFVAPNTPFVIMPNDERCEWC